MKRVYVVVEIIGSQKNYYEYLTRPEADRQLRKLTNLGSKAYIE